VSSAVGIPEAVIAAANRLIPWFLSEMGALHERSSLEQCELLLCASDFRFCGPAIDAALRQLELQERQTSSGDIRLFHSLARQLVLSRFSTAEDLRRDFLSRWIAEENFRSLDDVATSAFLMTLALEQETLLPITWHGYAARWFSRRTRFESDRFEAWACYCLSFAGRTEEAQLRANSLLAARNRNGSWANDLPRTIGCSHGLAASKCASIKELARTAAWVSDRLDTGFARDLTTKTQALKTFGLLHVVPEEEIRTMGQRIANPSSVFLSHSSLDKPFVRRLARELRQYGVKVWLDEAELLPGDSLFGKIESAITEMRYLAVVLSPNSVKSAWVTEELRMGQIRAIESREVVVLPILAQRCDVPLSLREKVWCDFTRSYEDGLQTLLRRLAPWSSAGHLSERT
jgi:hypothetical protein